MEILEGGISLSSSPHAIVEDECVLAFLMAAVSELGLLIMVDEADRCVEKGEERMRGKALVDRLG